MSSILHGFYNGKIIPWERRNSHNDKQRKILQKIESEERYFTEKLSADDAVRFQELSNLHLENCSQEEENIFSYGFTLGFLMMMDIEEQARRIVGE